MASKKKSVSLAEKISNLVTAVPKTFGSDDESEETRAKVVDYDDEINDNDDFDTVFNNSSIRKKNVGLLEEEDNRYKGKKISRKEIFNNGMSSEEDDEDEEDESNEDSDVAVSNDISDNNVSAEEDDDDDDEEGEGKEKENSNSDSDDNDDESEDYYEQESGSDDDLDQSIDLSNPLRKNRDVGGIQTMSTTNVRAEIEKGNCVREQLKMWENLLEMRIKLQKCLINSNKMPQYDSHKEYQSNNEFEKNGREVNNKLTGLLSNLLHLQRNLLNNFPETKGILSNSRKRKAVQEQNKSDEGGGSMDEEIPSDTEDEMNEDEKDDEQEELDDGGDKGPPKKKIKLSEFENILAKNHESYVEYRNSVIQKWNTMTRIASGVISKGINQPAVKQIEFALANKDKLVKKTQLKRSEYDIIGKSVTSLEENDGRRLQEYDTEIYDDDDFYHQLLRELIEYKSADITDPIQLSKQWIQLQNMRSKMKRKIDTRATKGRRIRYNVHQKLVNFMTPITVFDTWTDHAKDELYSSLFGKIKPANVEKQSA